MAYNRAGAAPASGACPARVPPRAAGRQAALAGASRRVTSPRPGGGGASGRGGGGQRGGAKRALNFLSARIATPIFQLGTRHMAAHTVQIEDFWLASDGNNWQPTFVRAQASAVNCESLTIVLQQRQYRCLAPIELFHHVKLQGPEAHGRVNFNSVDSGANRKVCTLYFPQSAGIIVRYPGHYMADVTARADFCTIQDV